MPSETEGGVRLGDGSRAMARRHPQRPDPRALLAALAAVPALPAHVAGMQRSGPRTAAKTVTMADRRHAGVSDRFHGRRAPGLPRVLPGLADGQGIRARRPGADRRKGGRSRAPECRRLQPGGRFSGEHHRQHAPPLRVVRTLGGFPANAGEAVAAPLDVRLRGARRPRRWARAPLLVPDSRPALRLPRGRRSRRSPSAAPRIVGTGMTVEEPSGTHRQLFETKLHKMPEEAREALASTAGEPE